MVRGVASFRDTPLSGGAQQHHQQQLDRCVGALAQGAATAETAATTTEELSC